VAFKLAELFVAITGDDRPLNRTLDVVHRRLSGIGATLAGAGVAAGLGAALYSAAREAISAEANLARLAKAADFSAADLESMRLQLRELAGTLRAVPYDDLVEIAVAGSKLGVANADLVEYTEGIAKLSIALDDIPAAEIADQVGKMNAVFKLGVEGAQQIGSAVDKLADSSVASAAGILAVSQRISGTAAASRLAAPDAIALATALLETGTRAEQAGSTINRLLVGLDLAGRLGEDSAGGVRAFLAELAGLDTAGRLAALGDLGIEGSEDFSEIQKLIAQVERLGSFSSLAREEFATLNQINKSFATQSAISAANVTEFGNRLQFLKQDIGYGLLPAVNVGLGLIGDLAAGFGESVTRMTAIGRGWGLDFSGVIDDVGYGFRNLPDFLAIAATSMYEKILNVVEWIGIIPANLRQVGAYIAFNWRDLVGAGLGAVLVAWTNFAENIKGLWTSVLDFLSTGEWEFDPKPLLDGFSAAVADLPPMIRPVLTDLSGEIERLYEEVGLREEERKRLRAEAAAGGGGAGGDAPGAAGATGRRPAEGIGTRQGLAEFARSLQEGVFGKGGVAEQQLAVQKEQLKTEQEQLAKLANLAMGAVAHAI
jgi:TP901 family phage tail tape measure protein